VPIELFHAQVSGVRDLTHDVREIALSLIAPKTIAFKAGQFISFEVSRQGRPGTVTRPYSIVSPPRHQEVVTIVLNRVPGGPGSTYLFSLREGDRTQFKGPAGTFYLREDLSRDLLFVATGTGIAPIRSMLLDWSHRGVPRSATLYWGLRSQRDLYYQDELERLAKAHRNFSFVTTLSRPEDGWQGPSGRVTGLVMEGLASVHHLAAYLCGNGGMIKDVTAILNGKGLCPIYREKYYDGAGEEDREA
jgi:NAD(P)H-flavin reductase